MKLNNRNTQFIVTFLLFAGMYLVCTDPQKPDFGDPPVIGNNKHILADNPPVLNDTLILYLTLQTGAEPLTYTWYKNDTVISRASSDSLKFEPLKFSDTGTYHCVVTNILGSDASKTYNLLITDSTKPEIKLLSPSNNVIFSDSIAIVILQIVDMLSGIKNVTIKGAVVFSADSIYKDTVILALGKNDIPVIAEDGFGNKDTLGITLTYDPTIIDTIKPSITKIAPLAKYVKISTITFSVKIVDACGISLVIINGDTTTSSNDTYSKLINLIPGMNPVTVIAKDASSNANKDTATFIIVNDSVLPVLSRYTPAQDSTVTGSNAKKIEIIAKDNYGIKEVAFSVGTTNYPVTAFNDTIYYATVTGLVHNTFTIINVQAKDSAENNMTLKIAIKYDSTLNDLDPPALVYNSGPKHNERVKTSTGTISYTITDKTGIDSVYYKLNGVYVSALTLLGNSIYECSYNFSSKYGINTIKIFAVDKAANHNKDSVLINLDFNTVPTAISNISPTDKSVNINTETGVTLSWNPATDMDGDTIKYLVYYGLDTNSLSNASLTTASFAIPSPVGASKYFWRVAVCTKLDTISCPSNSFYSFTTINKKATISGFYDRTCSIKDTLLFSVTASDPQGIKEYHWDFDNNGTADKITTSGSAAFVAGNSPAQLKAVLYVIDNKSDTTLDTALISVLLDPPGVNAGADTTCYKGKQITLTGKASDAYGTIVKQEWDLGATGTFQTTPDGKNTFFLPASYQKSFKCIFKATDDDGNYSADTVIVTVSSWEIIGDFSNVNLNSSTNAHYNNGNMAMDITSNGIPIVAYDIKDTNHFSLLQYSGSGTVWSNLNFSISNPFNGIWVPNVKVHTNSQIHLTFTRFVVGPSGPSGPGYDYFLDCIKHTGTSWTSLGTIDVKNHHNSYDNLFDRYRQLNSITFDNVGTPLILSNRNNDNNMFLKRFTGTTWEPLGADSASKIITSDSADFLSVEYSNGTPYVAYRNRANSFYARVCKFNGSSFEALGNSPTTSGKTSYLSFDVHNNIPYIAYIDTASGNRLCDSDSGGRCWLDFVGSTVQGRHPQRR